MSIVLSVVFVVATIICVSIIVNKANKTKEVYATSVSFNGARSFDLFIDNSLIINSSIITISPSNCSFEPEFTISKNTYTANGGQYTFNSVGKYTITCKVKSSSKFYVKDTLIVNVVDTPSGDMYIQKVSGSITAGQSVDLNEFVNIKCPENAIKNISASGSISFENNKITAITKGTGTLLVQLRYESMYIFKEININVLPYVDPQDIDIIFYCGENEYHDNDCMELKLNEVYTFTYNASHVSSQSIIISRCEKVNADCSMLPFIQVSPQEIGSGYIAIKLVEYLEIEFVLNFNIVE